MKLDPSRSGVPKVSLADDPEAQVELPKSLCPSRAAIERVIVKVFCRSHCDVVITDRLTSLFSLKLWRMGNAIQGLGGLARKRLYDKWKDSKWLIELVNEEIVLPHNCKVKPDNNNVILQSKKIKLEDQINAANEKLRDITNNYTALEKASKESSNLIGVEGGVSAMHTRKRKA